MEAQAVVSRMVSILAIFSLTPLFYYIRNSVSRAGGFEPDLCSVGTSVVSVR